MISYQQEDHTKKDMVYHLLKVIYLDLRQQIQIDQVARQNQKEKWNVKWETINKNSSKFIEKWLLELWSINEDESCNDIFSIFY